MFLPPINLGSFKPSPATLAQWVYDIWQYLQENPIATQEQLQEYIATFITTSPETQELIGEGVEQYLTDNPPQAPVQSVQGKTGAVSLTYPDIVPASNAVPVYKAASAPNASTAQGLYNNGYRLFVNTNTQEIFTVSPAGALSLVGRGKFDGTTVDVDSDAGDTTIAEAFAALETTQVTSGTTPNITDDSGIQSNFSWTRYKITSNLVIYTYRYNGVYNVNVNAVSSINITFPETFTTQPHVQITSFTASQSPVGCPIASVSAISTSSCQIRYFNSSDSGRAPTPTLLIIGTIAA